CHHCFLPAAAAPSPPAAALSLRASVGRSGPGRQAASPRTMSRTRRLRARLVVDADRPAKHNEKIGPRGSTAPNRLVRCRIALGRHMIKSFHVLYVGQIELDNIGLGGTPANERRYSDERLREAFFTARDVAQLMDELGFDVL